MIQPSICGKTELRSGRSLSILLRGVPLPMVQRMPTIFSQAIYPLGYLFHHHGHIWGQRMPSFHQCFHLERFSVHNLSLSSLVGTRPGGATLRLDNRLNGS